MYKNKTLISSVYEMVLQQANYVFNQIHECISISELTVDNMVAHSVKSIRENHVKPSFSKHMSREPSALDTRLCTPVYMV